MSYLFCFSFVAIPAAYGSSRAGGRIKAVAAGLHNSHSNTGSEQHLWPTLQVVAMLDALNEAEDQNCILTTQCWVCNLLSHNRNSLTVEESFKEPQTNFMIQSGNRILGFLGKSCRTSFICGI